MCLTTVSCGSSNETVSQTRNVSRTSTATKLSDGQYQVQQASFDDGTGEYTLFLLNSTPPTFKTENLQMARLTEEEIKEGKKTYLKVENGQPALFMTEDFKIEYVHNVTETQTNPQTGQQETVVVRRESNFWAPFAGAVAGNIAGQVIGNALFRPQYYVPPAYQSGGVLTGYGGSGPTYNQAVSSYQTRYNAPPAVERNRTTFRTTGNIRRSSPGSSTVRSTPSSNTGNRPTGSGFGGSNLKPSNNSGSTTRKTGSGFGSGGRSSGSRSRSGGRRR
ncbi:Superfamily II DNA and RNA helicase [Nodularia spumigena CCY9414]|nr:Superfamily II DNA and RNA helicase [Nodularia spumigena CCY9414]